MADFYFTRHAMRQLIGIYDKSMGGDYGEVQTKKYIDKIYNDCQKVADNSTKDNLRKHRSDPFLMQQAGVNHFIVYERFDGYIIIGAVLGQTMDIENHIDTIKVRVSAQILRMRKEL